jgi:hypothetical protein
LNLQKLILSDNEWQSIKRPRAARAKGIIIDVVGDTMVSQQALDAVSTGVKVLFRALIQEAPKGFPVGAQFARRHQHLIIDTSLGKITQGLIKLENRNIRQSRQRFDRGVDRHRLAGFILNARNGPSANQSRE